MRYGCFLQTSFVSPNYDTPQVIPGKLYAGPEVGVWICGFIFYALFCVTLLFENGRFPYLFCKIQVDIYIRICVDSMTHYLYCWHLTELLYAATLTCSLFCYPFR